MKDYFYLKKGRQLLFALLVLLAGGASPAWADELTVYDGTATNKYVPLYGYYVDTQGTISEFIIPSSQLTTLNGKTISQMSFYLSSPAASSWGAASFNVYLEEVAGSNYDDSSASQLTENKTLVYAGALDGTGSTMEIPFSTNYTYNGGNLLVAIEVGTKGTYKDAVFYGTTTSYYASRYKAGSSSATRVKFIPKTTFVTPTVGPGFIVKDGSTSLSSPYAYNFGLATAGATKVFTLSNPGTAATPISVDISGANGFTAAVEDNATSIPAGETKTLTITMPDATASGSVVVTPTGDGLSEFTFNVSGTVKDPNKMFEDFSGNALPDNWTTGGNKNWTFSNGYASSGGYSASYYTILTTPQLKFSNGEKFFFDVKGNSTYNNTAAGLKVKSSTDGTNFDNTLLEISYTDISRTDWTSFSVTIPSATIKYIRFDNCVAIDIDNIYGGEPSDEPNLKVTEPTSLDFGVITEAANKTFTIANTGKGTLEGISVTSSNSSIFSITGTPTSLAAGESAEVTITMAATTTGAQNSEITVSATGMEDVTFTVTGTVLPDDMSKEEFTNGLPTNWTNASWTFANGIATGKSSSAYLTTPKLVFAEGDLIVIKARRQDSDTSDYLTVQGSSDNGSTWTAYSKNLQNTSGLTYPDFGTIVLNDIPTTVNKLRFVGFYAEIDEIWGLTYAPVLSVTQGGDAVTTPANYDFGECVDNASVTFNFANAGAGTITITGVSVTGDGVAAYNTNYSQETELPFDLTINRIYVAGREGAQDAVVTVTTTEGDFVINVTGSDKAANAPELAVTPNEDAAFGVVTAASSKTYTVTNAGTGTLTVDIASDDAKFTVSAAQLADIAAGQSKTFDVIFTPVAETYGTFNANITITPTYNAEAAVVIAASAKVKDPNIWTEDFEGENPLDGWESSGFTVKSTAGSYSIKDLPSMFAVSTHNANYSTLVTPLLSANEGDKLTFDAYFYYADEKLKVEYSTDGTDWNVDSPLYEYAKNSFDSYSTHSIEIESPITGEFYLRFSASYSNAIDNIEGFKLAPKKAHAAEVKDKTIPASGNQYVEYTASVDVKVTGTNAEELTVKFFIGDTQYGEDVVKTVTAGSVATFEFTFTPTSAISGDAYFTIESSDISAFETSKVAVTIAAAKILDEMEAPELASGILPSVVLKYTAHNGWNTICMPFTLTTDILNSIFGEDWKAYEFKSYIDNVLRFETTTTFYAGYPYVIYVETAATHADGVILQNVNITQSSAQYDAYNSAFFRGTYAPVAAGEWTKNAETDDIYGITDEARIQKAGATASIDGFRAYFDLPSGASARLAFPGDGGQTTYIDANRLNNVEDGKAYNLQGQRVENLKKGLYIINGKKKVVRK